MNEKILINSFYFSNGTFFSSVSEIMSVIERKTETGTAVVVTPVWTKPSLCTKLALFKIQYSVELYTQGLQGYKSIKFEVHTIFV